MDVSRALLVLALAGCSGGKAKTVEDARQKPSGDAPGEASADAPAVTPAAVRDYRVDATGKTGDVQIKVEWKDTPQALRAPGPPTRCKSPRRPAVVPATLWGVADVLVTVDVDHGKAFEAPQARVVLGECAFSSRAVVAGASVAIASAMHEPVEVTLQELARPLGGAPLSTPSRVLRLPIAGHELDVALEPNTVYALAYGTDDVAAVVAATTPYVGVTDPSGTLVLRDVPVGTHPVRAVLPARNGGDARTAVGTVTVTAGSLAEVTLDISRP